VKEVSGVGRSPQPRFSVVVLTRNEERALPHLLRDLEEFRRRGGEVLVVDTGSTDETRNIARATGCRVERLEDRFDSLLSEAEAEEIERRLARDGEGPLVQAGQRLFHFGEARQTAGLLATHPFVLQIDACDVAPAFDIDALDRHIASGRVAAFEYDQLYGNVRLRIMRFYDRNLYRWEGRVHECLIAEAGVKTPAATRCDESQLFVRHDKDEAKPRSYLAGLARQVFAFPEKKRWLHYLGRELFYEHWYRSAIPVLEEHAAIEGWATERSQSLCYAGQCHEALGHSAEAEDRYRRALGLDPTRREPLLRLAASLCSRGEFAEAVRFAREALAVPRTSGYPELEENYTWIPHSLLYWSLFWLDRKDEARSHWETYLSLVPEETRVAAHARLFP
jgi:tetratricopeptide (TPR) repeat protein